MGSAEAAEAAEAAGRSKSTFGSPTTSFRAHETRLGSAHDPPRGVLPCHCIVCTTRVVQNKAVAHASRPSPESKSTLLQTRARPLRRVSSGVSRVEHRHIREQGSLDPTRPANTQVWVSHVRDTPRNCLHYPSKLTAQRNRPHQLVVCLAGCRFAIRSPPPVRQ